MLLAFNLTEVDLIWVCFLKNGLDIDRFWLYEPQTAQKLYQLTQCGNREDFYAIYHSSFTGILPRENHAPKARIPGQQGHRERAPHRFDASVKREFAQDQVFGESALGYNPCGS
jgi:hypothetical protein